MFNKRAFVGEKNLDVIIMHGTSIKTEFLHFYMNCVYVFIFFIENYV